MNYDFSKFLVNYDIFIDLSKFLLNSGPEAMKQTGVNLLRVGL